MSRDFDGSTSYSFVDATPVTAAPFTVSAWFRSDSATVDQTIVSITTSTVDTSWWGLLAGGAAGGDPVGWLVLGPSGPTRLALTTTGYTVDQWHHAAGVEISDASRAVYIDGGSVGTNANSAIPTAVNRVAVGQLRNSIPALEFDGQIAHVTIWDIVLTAQEITSLASGISSLQMRPANIVYYAPFNGNQDPEADIVGGNDMTLNATTRVGEEPPITRPIVTV